MDAECAKEISFYIGIVALLVGLFLGDSYLNSLDPIKNCEYNADFSNQAVVEACAGSNSSAAQ